MIEKIKKENGKYEAYSMEKATNSIYNTMLECDGLEADKEVAKTLAEEITNHFEDAKEITTNNWAEAAFPILKNYNKDLCECYKQNRVNKQLNRLKNSSLMKSFADILEKAGDDGDSINTENANIDGFNPAAQLHRIGSETNKGYVLDYILPKQYAKSHREKWIHIHDLDYFELNPNCLQIDLKSILKDGYSTGSGYNTEPKSILTASMLSAIVLQSSTNNMHGGQSLANLDIALSKYVNISFRKHFKNNIENYYDVSGKQKPEFINARLVNRLYYGITIDKIKQFREEYLNEKNEKATAAKLKVIEKFLKVAERETERETDQAMQGLCHNLQTLHSRAGDQVPFSSCNFGLDTSEAGRLISRCLINNLYSGSGNGETFIYPIAIFHVLEGINYYKEDKNYDLFQMAMKSSSIRFYPNYVFLDSPLQYCYIRDKRGKLLWKARENWYISQGLVEKDVLDTLGEKDNLLKTNLLERIRAVAKIDRELRIKNQVDALFDVESFVNGTNNSVAVRRARAKGVEYPTSIDSLRVGLDDRTVAYRMGCRTLTISDNLVRCDCTQEPGKDYKFERTERPPYGITSGRGNFSFVTMNLPRFAIDAVLKTDGAELASDNEEVVAEKYVSEFYKTLLKYMLEAKNILRIRQAIIGNKIARNFSFIAGEGLVTGSFGMDANDNTYDLWEHFSKSIGYIGLYEVMKVLYNKKQIDTLDKEIEIISFMRRFTDNLSKGYYVLPTEEGLKDLNWYKEIFNTGESTFCSKNPVKSDWDIKFQVYDIDSKPIFLNNKRNKLKKGNWSVFATPAEGACMSFYNADRKEYGVIKDITDKGYYTNSNHVDVREPVSVEDKARLEGPFHTLANAGHIFYIEADGFIGKNVSAYKEILDVMHDNEMGYVAVNIPNDFCEVCRYQGVIPEGEGCPKCGNKDEDMILRTRRVTGYLSPGGVRRFNSGKRNEEKNRVKHTKTA